ncbi:hypothetical protein KC622_00350 [Candidatus Dojkabacteria bacterium]|uniref:Uncharacterized protein n=1 Tax=Candidatus Dojkabacteria bacterium TaxID=2099670 RepID=A0A955KWA8_9BACT|nr:hypothetical protein [Candidatus Dojkabacteria bacterium]
MPNNDSNPGVESQQSRGRVGKWLKGKVAERLGSAESKEKDPVLAAFTDFAVKAEELSQRTGVDVAGEVVKASDEVREWFWPKVEKGGPIALTVATVVFPTSRLRWEAAKQGTMQDGLEKVSKIAGDIEPMTGPFAPFFEFGRQFLLAEHRARKRNLAKAGKGA